MQLITLLHVVEDIVVTAFSSLPTTKPWPAVHEQRRVGALHTVFGGVLDDHINQFQK